MNLETLVLVSIILGIVALAVAGISLYLQLRLFHRKPHQPTIEALIRMDADKVADAAIHRTANRYAPLSN